MMIHYISIPQYQVYDNTLYSLYAGNFFKAERPFRNIGTSGSNPLQMFHPLRCFIIGANRISGKRVFEYDCEEFVSKDTCIIRSFSNYKYDNMYTILDKNINEAFLFKNIEIALDFLYTNKKLQFENGFYFDMNRELLFQGKKTIKLTKTEKKLINLLALNPNVLVTYEHISSVVWKGKEFSIYSLRNVIKHIREKTDETFIKNSSNKGYVINTI